MTFTNEIQYLQKLTLEKKTVKADGSEYDCKESFDFTIKFSNLKPGQGFVSTVGKVKADEDGDAEKTISLKNGEKAEFYKIPYGTEYQITEEKNKYAPSYRIDAATVKRSQTKLPQIQTCSLRQRPLIWERMMQSRSQMNIWNNSHFRMPEATPWNF